MDELKFPFELPTGDEGAAKNPPLVPPMSRPAPIPPPIPPKVPSALEPKVSAGLPGQGAPDFFAPGTFEPSPVPPGVSTNSKVVKNIVMIVVALVFVGGIGALSYFVVFPLLFPPQSAKAPQVVATPVTHKSYLVLPVAAEAQLNLPDHKYLTIASAMQNESFNQLAAGQYKEVKVFENNQQVAFPDFMAAISPVTSALSNGGYFEKDFTALLYYDASGVWPVYVAKMKAGTIGSDLVASFKSLEGVLDVANFYLAPPGSFSGFKDGKVDGQTTRYAVGTQAGAAFNYGALGEYFVISTNYNGLKNLMPLIGLAQPSSDR